MLPAWICVNKTCAHVDPGPACAHLPARRSASEVSAERCEGERVERRDGACKGNGSWVRSRDSTDEQQERLRAREASRASHGAWHGVDASGRRASSSSQSLTCGTDHSRTFAPFDVPFEMVQQAQCRRCTNPAPQVWRCRARPQSVPQRGETEKCYVYSGD